MFGGFWIASCAPAQTPLVAVAEWYAGITAPAAWVRIVGR